MTAQTDQPASTARRRAWTAVPVLGGLLLGATLVACGGSLESRTTSPTPPDSMVAPAPPDATGATATNSGVEALLHDAREITGEAGAANSASPATAQDAASPRKQLAPSVAPGAPAVPATGAGSTGGQPAEPSMPSLDFLGRSIIRTGSIDLQVESISDSFERVSAIATGSGGFVAESRFFGRQDPTIPPRTDGRESTQPVMPRPPQGGASLTLRIPAHRFDDVIQQLRGVAVEVRSINTGSQDVTGDVTDLESTLRNLRAVEARYLEMLGSARTTADILQIQDRINQTRAQIERADGRLSGLKRLADMSTLTVSLSPAAPATSTPTPNVFAPVREAWQASLEALQSLGLAILIAGAFGWWMLPLVAVALWVASRVIRNMGGRVAPANSIDTPQTTA